VAVFCLGVVVGAASVGFWWGLIATCCPDPSGPVQPSRWPPLVAWPTPPPRLRPGPPPATPWPCCSHYRRPGQSVASGLLLPPAAGAQHRPDSPCSGGGQQPLLNPRSAPSLATSSRPQLGWSTPSPQPRWPGPGRPAGAPAGHRQLLPVASRPGLPLLLWPCPRLARHPHPPAERRPTRHGGWFVYAC